MKNRSKCRHSEKVQRPSAECNSLCVRALVLAGDCPIFDKICQPKAMPIVVDVRDFA